MLSTKIAFATYALQKGHETRFVAAYIQIELKYSLHPLHPHNWVNHHMRNHLRY